MKIALATAMTALTLMASSALAQSQNVPVPVQSDTERVSLAIVFGEDPCPKSEGEEIVVCARKAESERFRIPQEFRGDPNAPANQAWGERAKSIEYVGASGTDSCSPVGGGGFTGCFNKIAQAAKAERRQADNVSWNDLVAAERAKRLSTIDADSAKIEAQVKAEEAAKARAATSAVSPSPTPPQ